MIKIRINDHRIKRTSCSDILIFCFPIAIIVTQNINVGVVKVSWLISAVSALYILFHVHMIWNCVTVLVVSLMVITGPLLTSLWSLSPQFNSGLYFSLLTGLITFILICCFNRRQTSVFLEGCFYACLLFSLWGCYEVLTGHYIMFHNLDFTKNLNPYGNHYPGVAFANPNDLAQYIAILAPISTISIQNRNQSKLHFIAVITLIISSIIVIVNSLSNLSMISYAGTILLFILLVLARSKKRFIIILIAVFIIIVLFLFNLLTGYISIIINDFLTVDTTQGYFTIRENIYLSLFHIANQAPFGGFGNSYFFSEMGPHNLFLFVLCDLGYITAILFVFSLVYCMYNALKGKVFDGNSAFGFMLFSTLVFFPLTSSISSGNEQRKIIWLFFGICVKTWILYKERKIKRNR